MGALTIAFDTTIVGALALPWVALVVHLFFFRGENTIVALLRWMQETKSARRGRCPAIRHYVFAGLGYIADWRRIFLTMMIFTSNFPAIRR